MISKDNKLILNGVLIFSILSFIQNFTYSHGQCFAQFTIGFSKSTAPGYIYYEYAGGNSTAYANYYGWNPHLIKMVPTEFNNNNIIDKLSSLKSISTVTMVETIMKGIENIEQKWLSINKYMNQVKGTLDDAVHGHEKAKTQIERIIAQWINGEQGGYCFGFEGPAGVGKTTFAKKGLAKCLIDENGEHRPFSFIAMGGQDNGSTLNGHNYTYVGSEWGKIVDILMKNKCMPQAFREVLDLLVLLQP